jgi:hypothetical protein
LKKHTATILSVTLCVLFFVSCSTFKRSIASENDRKSELHSLMPRIVRAYRWASFEELAPLFSEKLTVDSVHAMHKFYKNKKVKEVDVQQIDFEEDVYKAYQLLEVNTFSSPRYMIESHIDQLTWEFSVAGGGWKIVRIDIGSSSSIDDPELP